MTLDQAMAFGIIGVTVLLFVWGRLPYDLVALLALSDEGRPAYDQENAAALAALGAPAFACTPDLFPDLMAAAIEKRVLGSWAADHEIVTSHGGAR